VKIQPMGGNAICIEFESGEQLMIFDSTSTKVHNSIIVIEKGKSPFQMNGKATHYGFLNGEITLRH